MATVLGIGGIFFKSKDPKALMAWYAQWLGMTPHWETGTTFPADKMPGGGYAVFSPFPDSTNSFEPSTQPFMFNLVVDDVKAMLGQIRPSGANVIEKVEASEYGTFGWFVDPDGNKVELWTPPAK
ncbi:MAG TPA: VOC family protein [Planctomycetota bacterium]|nr:VOC family protein [Planctomycetota bacterium]